MSNLNRENEAKCCWNVRQYLLTCILVLAATGNNLASAETTECNVINSVPIVINTQGVWCVKKNLSTNISEGAAIEVTANNVTIDFNGFKLGGLGAGPSTNADGVYALNRRNITIRGGNIRGYRNGINLVGGIGHVIEDNSFEGNIAASINLRNGIVQSAVIRNNRVQGMTQGFQILGIWVQGQGIVIENNVVTGIGNGSSTFGIGLWAVTDSWVKGNIVSNIDGSSNASGILFESNSSFNEVKGNLVTSQINVSRGIWLLGAGENYCRDNTVINAADAFAGSACSFVGHNAGVDTPAPAALAEGLAGETLGTISR